MTVTLEPGEVIAGYRIVGMLGRGGMGAVYRAEDLSLGRHVALKVLNPALAADARFRERFERESRLLASIDHANIVDVFHAGHADGVAFLVMRLIDGFDLGTLLGERRVLERAVVTHVVDSIAAALDTAHSHGLVHRDVKPANILIAPGGGPLERARVYLSDFGLTKRVTDATRLTSTGQFLGTVEYVAPEQIQGGSVDGRADLYSLACVAYECLAGRAPFGEAREAAALMAHLVAPAPDLLELRPDLPPAAAAALRAGMAKSREDRPARCAEFAAALREALMAGAAPSAAAVVPPPQPFEQATSMADDRPAARTPPEGPKWPVEWSASELDPRSPTIIAPAPLVGAAPARPLPPSPRPRSGPATGVVRPRPRERSAGSRVGVLAGVLLTLMIVAGAVAFASGLFAPGGSPPASPDGDLTADARLVAHIPSGLRPTCVAEAPVDPALATRRCVTDDGIVEVRYALYRDSAAMDRAYEDARRQLGIERNAGSAGTRCSENARWPNEGAYTVRDAPTGRLLCLVSSGMARLDWTDRRADVLTSALDRNGDQRRLFRFWRDGRLPAATASGAPTSEPLPATPPPTDAPPTDVPTAAPPTDPPPTLEPAAQLRLHIPSQLRPVCETAVVVEPALAAEECLLDDDSIFVRYVLFRDLDAMAAAYEEARLGFGIERDSAPERRRCRDPETWPHEGPYTISGQPAGRLMCHILGGDAHFAWTDERINVLTTAIERNGEAGLLRRFWLDRAGPVE